MTFRGLTVKDLEAMPDDDRVTKLGVYADAWIPHIWIADQVAPRLDLAALRDPS